MIHPNDIVQRLRRFSLLMERDRNENGVQLIRAAIAYIEELRRELHELVSQREAERAGDQRPSEPPATRRTGE